MIPCTLLIHCAHELVCTVLLTFHNIINLFFIQSTTCILIFLGHLTQIALLSCHVIPLLDHIISQLCSLATLSSQLPPLCHLIQSALLLNHVIHSALLLGRIIQSSVLPLGPLYPVSSPFGPPYSLSSPYGPPYPVSSPPRHHIQSALLLGDNLIQSPWAALSNQLFSALSI